MREWEPFIVIFIGLGLLFCLIKIICFFGDKAEKKEKMRKSNELDKTVSSAILDVAKDFEKSEFTICPYCGNAVKKSEQTCSGCGALISEVVQSSLSELTKDEILLYMYHIGLMVIKRIGSVKGMQYSYKAAEDAVNRLCSPVKDDKLILQILSKSKREIDDIDPAHQAFLVYARYQFIKLAKSIVLEKASERHSIIICDACGSFVDIDNHLNCPHCGHPYGNDTEMQDIMNVLITDSNIYMDTATQKQLTRKLYAIFTEWDNCILENISQGNVQGIYPPGYEEICKYIQKQNTLDMSEFGGKHEI